MDSKVIIDADIDTSSYILYILDRLAPHSEFYPTNDDFYEENYITKYKFDELEIINGILYRLNDSTWHIHLVCRGKLSILINLSPISRFFACSLFIISLLFIYF